MKLQTDPSVIYGLGGAYDGKIHRRDLDADTPFNTYTRTRAAADPDRDARQGGARGRRTPGRNVCAVFRSARRRLA